MQCSEGGFAALKLLSSRQAILDDLGAPTHHDWDTDESALPQADGSYPYAESLALSS